MWRNRLFNLDIESHTSPWPLESQQTSATNKPNKRCYLIVKVMHQKFHQMIIFIC